MCSPAQAALYLFLVCVADERGLSYYGDTSLMARLSMDYRSLQKARTGLIKHSLIAWKKPIYQVLHLGPTPEIRCTGSGMDLKDILRTAKEVTLD